MGLKREKVIITNKAQESIKYIYTYLKEEASLQIAKNVKDSIIAKCKSLKDFSGYSVEIYLSELEGDYRSVTLWDYLIIYRQTDKTIRVLNVIHTSKHPDKRKNI